ncbi:MAG: hypothetical protein KGH57_01210 [Candidatus Micrarchaeota archaeon]|nr:hypothetical protein [Candidatus Micrarchaeota archaeon]
MKIFIISLDMLIALPILSVAMIFLFSSMRGTQSYLLALGSSRGPRLNALVASQQISQAIDNGAYNYSTALQLAGGISAKYGLSSQILNQGSIQQCGNSNTVCRLTTISGNAYLLVVSYEGAS